MKPFIIIILFFTSLSATSQEASRDSLNRAIEEHVKATYSAASRFLDRELPATARLKIIEPYTVIYDSLQAILFKGTVLSEREPSEIRAAALHRIYQQAIADPQFRGTCRQWLGNPQTPQALRNETLQLEGVLSLQLMDMPEVYQKLLDDPQLPFRLFAFTKLVSQGDARAQERLISGLENPQDAALPAPTAIGVLSFAEKKEYFPVLYRVLQTTKDEAARLEAIRSLGPYLPARPALVTISRSASEKEPFREAALGALYSGDRENITRYATPLLVDSSASPRLQAIAIQMTIDVRQAMSYRVKNKKGDIRKADDYDVLIRNIAADRSKEAGLQRVAEQYLQTVRPQYN